MGAERVALCTLVPDQSLVGVSVFTNRSMEWHCPAGEHIEDDAEAVDVSGRGGLITCQDLGGSIDVLALRFRGRLRGGGAPSED